MVRTSAIVLGAMAFCVAPTLAAPIVRLNELEARHDEGPLSSDRHSQHGQHHSHAKLDPGPGAPPPGRRGVEDEQQMFARQTQDSPLLGPSGPPPSDLSAAGPPPSNHHRSHSPDPGQGMGAPPPTRRDFEAERLFARHEFEGQKHRLHQKTLPDDFPRTAPGRRDVDDYFLFAREIDELD